MGVEVVSLTLWPVHGTLFLLLVASLSYDRVCVRSLYLFRPCVVGVPAGLLFLSFYFLKREMEELIWERREVGIESK